MLSERISEIQTELNPKKNSSFELDIDFGPKEFTSNQILSHTKTLVEYNDVQNTFQKKDYSKEISQIDELISKGEISSKPCNCQIK